MVLPALAPPGHAVERGVMGVVVQPRGPACFAAGADVSGAAGRPQGSRLVGERRPLSPVEGTPLEGPLN